jgi:starch-binding outer membrane protein, SusD/RagB family
MKKMKSIVSLSLLTIALSFSACFNDLNREPFDDITSAQIYKDPANYKSVLAKLYAGLAITGQKGPSGAADISRLDEGFSNYLRLLFKMQELPTDEAVIGWGDGTLPTFHTMTWTPSNEFIGAMYSRIYYQVALVNEFIRETSDDKLKSRGLTSNADIKAYRAEARFLRALSYWHALDLFGNPSFVTEEDGIGTFLPRQIKRADLFTYIESELKAIEPELIGARQNEYARADKAAAWTLLAKLYLNAEVYTGQAKNTEAIDYAKRVIGAGYALEPKYTNLFRTDNDKSKEVIFPLAYDGLRTRTWGGMTFLVHAPVGGTMRAADFGINGGWNGLRTTQQFVGLFPDTIAGGTYTDDRAMFHYNGQTKPVTTISVFSNGYGITKYKNISSEGVKGSDPAGDHPDTDYPMFRLADIYLIYAEAVLRGGSGGDNATALKYVNDLRTRAKATTVSSITLDGILDERGRELYWECHRRTDLIRFKKFTEGSYLWDWKGNVVGGKGVSEHLKIYPIPNADRAANPNLNQNPDYK